MSYVLNSFAESLFSPAQHTITEGNGIISTTTEKCRLHTGDWWKVYLSVNTANTFKSLYNNNIKKKNENKCQMTDCFVL